MGVMIRRRRTVSEPGFVADGVDADGRGFVPVAHHRFAPFSLPLFETRPSDSRCNYNCKRKEI